MSIVGVSLDRKRPGEAFLHWDREEPTVGCTGTTDTLNIKIVDPAALARGVNVSFELRNTDSTTTGTECQRPITKTNGPVTVQAVAAYDENGVSIPFPALEPEYFGGN